MVPAVSKHLLTLSAREAARRLRVLHIANCCDGEDPAMQVSLRQFRSALRARNIEAAPFAAGLFKTIRRIRASEADIVHVHLPDTAATFAYLLSGHAGRLVVTWHSGIELAYGMEPVVRSLLRRAAAILIALPIYAREHPILAEFSERCRVVPFGINLQAYSRPNRAIVSRLRRAHTGPVVLAVGEPQIETLLRAMREVPADLVIAGADSRRAELERLAGALGIKDRVSFAGRERSIERCHAADIVVARGEFAQLEAMACGKPVVNTTDAPGAPFVSVHGLTGFTVAAGDDRNLAAALNLLLGDPERRAEYGRAARQRVFERFSVERMAERTIAVYDEVMHGPVVPALPRRAGQGPSPLYPIAKRALDIAGAAAAVVVLSPVLLAIAAAIKLTSHGPVFYCGERLGRNGRTFRILKFRTMVPDAEVLGSSATANDDPRLTRIGKALRRHKLDELPQLFNVLAGSMSLVGPRPSVKKYLDYYAGHELRVFEMRPGITDWASIWNVDEGSVLEGSPDPDRTYEIVIMPTKKLLQLLYYDQQSIAVDLKILFHTAFRIFNRNWMPAELKPYGSPGPPARLRSAQRSEQPTT